MFEFKHFFLNVHTGQIIKQHYLVDGGPTQSHQGPPPKVYQYLFRYLITECLEPSSKTNFSLNGIVVTHTDGDHIDGIIKLLKTYPPTPVSINTLTEYKFVFQGPVLITSIFKHANKGKELIKLLTDSNFKVESLSSITDFGTQFHFHFSTRQPGVLYKYASVSSEIMTLAYAQVPTRYTIDDSKPNLSSIITTWGVQGNHGVVLTGDAPGHRILKVINPTGKIDPKNLKEVDFFQVPHHGSARNSLPLDQNLLPPTEDIHIVEDMIRFRVILGYSLKNRVGSLNDMEKQDLLKKWVGTKLMNELRDKLDYSFKFLMEEYLGAKFIEAIKATNIHPPVGKTKEMFVFDQASAGLKEVAGNVKEYIEKPSDSDIQKIFSTKENDLFSKKGRSYFYTSIINAALKLIKGDVVVEKCNLIKGTLSRIRNPFLEQVMPSRVSLMYTQFHAQIYYISSSTNHGHPSAATISGIIEAAKVKKKSCTILLSSGYVLPSRSLQFTDYKTWENLVKIQYFTGPYASVNPQTLEIKFTEEFVPGNYNAQKLDTLKTDLETGAASRYFSSGFSLNDTNYRVSFNHDNKTYYLSLEEDAQNTYFIATESEAILKIIYYENKLGTVCTFSSGVCQMQARVEISLHEASKYILYDISDDKKKNYWAPPKVGTDKLRLNPSMSAAITFTFTRSCKRRTRPDSYYLKLQLGHIDMAQFSSFTALPTAPSSTNVNLKKYFLIIGVPFPANGITVNDFYDLLLGNNITQQLTSYPGPPDFAKIVTDTLSYMVNDTSSFTVSSAEEILSASILVKLPSDPPSFLGAPVKSISFDICFPRTDMLKIKMVINDDFIAKLSNKLKVSTQGKVLSEFLKEIKFTASIDNIQFSDMVMLFVGSYFEGLTSVTSLPLALVQTIASWKVDNYRSTVKSVALQSSPFVTSATIFASVPSSPKVVFQNFKMTIQELYMQYPVLNQTFQLSGEAVLSYKPTKKQLQVEFTAIPCTNDSTPEIHFQFETGLTLSKLFSFLKLANLENIHVPFLGKALSGIHIAHIGMSLKQGIQDSADTYYVHSLSFSTQISNFSAYLPNGIVTDMSNINCSFSVLLPTSSKPLVGFDFKFVTSIGNKQSTIQLPCEASLLQIEAANQREETGYTCFLKFSTAVYNQEGQYIGPSKLDGILSAIGFGTEPQLSAAIPVVGSFLQEISLQDMQMTYNTATKKLTSLYLQVAVPNWKLACLGVSLNNFEVELQYSESSGWEANLQSDVQLGTSESYYNFTITFSLPTVSNPGKLSFVNTFEDLTIEKAFSLLSLTLPSQIPVLGSILGATTVKQVILGLETNGKTPSLYGAKLEFYIKSMNLQVFQLKSVDVVLAYNKTESGSEVSYQASGFINKKIFVKTAYDPSSKQFTGQFQVTNFQTLSVNDARSVLLIDSSLAQNTAYSSVASQPSADTSITLFYDSASQKVALQEFSISIEDVFNMSFGNLSLVHFSLQYTKKNSSQEQPPKTAGFDLVLQAILLQKSGQFGLQLNFDCTVSDSGSNTLRAKIQPIPGKEISLRSFLALTGVATPPLPESASASKPLPHSSGSLSEPPENYLDLKLESGSITFITSPTKMLESFEVTTALATTGAWTILDNPNIQLSQIKLSVSYNCTEGATAALFGTIVIGSVNIFLKGTRSGNNTTFNLAASSVSNFTDLMNIVDTLSPSSKQGISIPRDAGLPQKLPGSFSVFSLVLSPEMQTFNARVSLKLGVWDYDLGLKNASFHAKELQAELHWEAQVKNKKARLSISNYSLRIEGELSFGSIPVSIVLDVGSTKDTVVQAVINNPSALQLSTITDKTLGFAPKSTSPSPQYSDLLPQGMSEIAFSSGYLQFNLTKKLVLLFGTVKNLGTCLLIAGKIQDSSGLGYAITLTVSELSNLLPPLAKLSNVLSLRNINASVVNLCSLRIEDLTAIVKVAEQNLAQSNGQPPNSSLPFSDLHIASGSSTADTKLNKGVCLYCELSLDGSSSQLMKNLVSIQQDNKNLPLAILFAQYAGEDPVTKSEFIAFIPSLTLFGALHFKNIKLTFSYDINQPSPGSLVLSQSSSQNHTGPSLNPSPEGNSYTLSLQGDITVEQIASATFHGTLSICKDMARFKLVGNDQPININAPLNMFGVIIENPKLSVTYHYDDGKRSHSNISLSGIVNFYSTPPKENSTPAKPSLTLVGKCVWADSSLSAISIELNPVSKPLTLSDLIATVFSQSWDSYFIDIGLYDGKIYYAPKEVTVDGYTYESGYNIACNTFIFKENFAFRLDMNLPLNKSGFTASGSGIKPIDLGFATLSTQKMDENGQFKNLGPTLQYKYLKSKTSISLGVGVTFLDVKVAALEINYIPSQKEFVFQVTYPEKFLGANKPEISCTWSKENGFQITSWSLGSPDVPQFTEKLMKEIQQWAEAKTANGCAAITDFAFRQAIKTKVSISMQTTKSAPNDLIAFKLAGNYSISVASASFSLPLPDIVVHIPKPENKSITMANVAKYILNAIVSNAGSMVEQIVSNPEHLKQIITAVAFQQLVKKSKEVIASLICRGLSKEELSSAGTEAEAAQTGEAETQASEVAEAVDEVSKAGTLGEAMTAADTLIGVNSVLGTLLGGLSGILDFFDSSSNKNKKMEQIHKNATKKLEEKMSELLTVSGSLNHSIIDGQLTLNWTPLNSSPSSLQYSVTLNLTAPPHIGPFPPINKNVTTPNATFTEEQNDHVLLSSVISVDVRATVTVKDKTFSGPALNAQITNTATLPAPESVTLQNSDQSLTATVNGVPEEAQSVKADLLGIDSNNQVHLLQSKQESNSTSPVMFTFDYYAGNAEFSSKGLKVKAQCLRSGLQSSKFEVSSLIPRLLPPTATQYTLPDFNDPNPSINVEWTLQADVPNVQDVLIEIVADSSTPTVILSKSLQKKAKAPPPSSVSLSLAEFKKAIGAVKTRAAYYVIRSSLIPNSQSLLPSIYSHSIGRFSIATPPSDVSATFISNAKSLTVSWTPVSNTDTYALQILNQEKKVVLSHTCTEKNQHTIGQPQQESYSLTSSDMLKLTPGDVYTVEMFSIGNSQSLLSSFTAAEFQHIRYFCAIQNFSVAYNVQQDEVTATFDGNKWAKGYILGVLECLGAQVSVIATFSIPATSQSVIQYPLHLTKFRSKLSDGSSCGFQISAFGSASDIPSAYVKGDKTWTTAEHPGNVHGTYDPNTNALNVTCDLVKDYSSYNLMVKNEGSGQLVVKSSSSKPPEATWNGTELKGSGQFLCIAQTIGTADLFSSKLVNGALKFTKLDPVSTSPTVTYDSDVKNMKLSYPFIQNAQSYYFKLNIHREGKVQTVHTIPNYQPPLHDKEVTITFDLSSQATVPGDCLVVITCAKGGGNFLNSNTSQFSSGAIQELEQPQQIQLLADLQEDALNISWKEVPSASSYEVGFFPSVGKHSWNNFGIKSTSYEVKQISSYYQNALVTVQVNVSAHSGAGSKPLLPSKKSEESMKIGDKFIEDVAVDRVSSSTAVIKWKFPQSITNDTKVFVVTNPGNLMHKATGDQGNVHVEGLVREKKYSMELKYSRRDPTVIGIPVILSVPGMNTGFLLYFKLSKSCCIVM